MSLITDFHDLFTKTYPSLSVGKLQAQLELVQNDRRYIQIRLETLRCECEQDSCPLVTFEHKDGRCKVRYQNIDVEHMCEKCQKTFGDFPSHWIGAGYSRYDHYHPRLLLETANYQERLLERAIVSKQEDYMSLSNEELETVKQEIYDESRYLRRSETDFQWRNEDVPQGLLDAIDRNDEKMEAIDFEKKSRTLRGLPLNEDPSPDTFSLVRD